ncbi:Retrovirus-related Pol polyprotein from transposon [Smittium culicis]|uniref:Retrovirus-related Pol polyprotein from transposon n=1 Tax=Smittium culicis TaxID=133412 RepID=A0A1R1XPS8_9FUNG|nr:Retrovirus-related Pol polyprotein from transposon [Smittium culicis]
MNPIIATEPFEIIGLDAVGPISPISCDGNRYLLTAIDYLTKWPICRATKDIKTQTVINFLIYDVVQNYGTPRQLITDRGSNFVSDIAEKFYDFLNIKHTPATSYRPQTNGQVERLNQSIKSVLSKICESDQENWDQYIWKMMLTLRTMKSRITKYSPSELLYGTKIITPVAWKPRSENDDINEDIFERVKRIDLEIPEMRLKAFNSSVKNKKYEAKKYNENVKLYKFKVGDKVLKQVEVGDKFGPKWEGPYTIYWVHGKGSYVIQDINDNRDLVNGDRLKIYNENRNMIPEVRPSRIIPTLRQFRQQNTALSGRSSLFGGSVV